MVPALTLTLALALTLTLTVGQAMFLQLTKEQGSTLTRRMHERFERRQRTRLKRAIEMLDRDVSSG